MGKSLLDVHHYPYTNQGWGDLPFGYRYHLHTMTFSFHPFDTFLSILVAKHSPWYFLEHLPKLGKNDDVSKAILTKIFFTNMILTYYTITIPSFKKVCCANLEIIWGGVGKSPRPLVVKQDKKAWLQWG